MLSHHGAVGSRLGDPCHYHCPHEMVSDFGPTYMIHSVALSTLAPQLESQGWKKGTRGDICESLMGFAYLVHRGRLRGDLRKTKQVGGIIDGFSWMAYRLSAITGDDFFVWVRWIIDTVAWRKDALGGEDAQEAAHPSLALVCAEADPVE